MSDSEHSHAPWHVSKHTDSRMALIYDADGFEVARVCYPNRDANAILIAQAPEMSEEIIRLRAEVERMKQERHKSISTLPDCMMPDGGDPCVGYIQIYNESERMAETLHRIGKITLAPGNWRVKDQVALNGMVAAVRDLDQALNIVAEIAKQMDRIADARKTDWDMRGFALALRGTIMDMGYMKDEP